MYLRIKLLQPCCSIALANQRSDLILGLHATYASILLLIICHSDRLRSHSLVILLALCSESRCECAGFYAALIIAVVHIPTVYLLVFTLGV